jgi:hypothetical protein
MKNLKVVGVKGNVIGYVIERLYIGITESVLKDLVTQYNITTINILKNVMDNEFGSLVNVRATKPRN